MYLKRGMLIRLTLNDTHSLYSLDVNQAVRQGDFDHFRLDQPQARIFYTRPDEQHLILLKNQLVSKGQQILPIHCWESHDLTHTAASSVLDVSSAMSLIEKSFCTWVNRADNKIFAEGSYELEYPGSVELSCAGA